VRVGADKPSYDHAIWGIAEGTAIEVMYELGLQPSYINLRNLESSKGLP